MNLIDTHCHIYYDKYNDDIDQVISRSKENNISNILKNQSLEKVDIVLIK